MSFWGCSWGAKSLKRTLVEVSFWGCSWGAKNLKKEHLLECPLGIVCKGQTAVFVLTSLHYLHHLYLFCLSLFFFLSLSLSLLSLFFSLSSFWTWRWIYIQANQISEALDLGSVDTLRCGYFGELNLEGWIWEALIRLDVGIRRTKAGRRWIWQALIRLDVGL